MRTFDYLKDIYNLHGKTIGWALIEVTDKNNPDKKPEYSPGLYIKGSKVAVNLYERRFRSPIELGGYSRRVLPAKLQRSGKDFVILVAKDDSSKYMLLPPTFVKDIHYATRYEDWMENKTIF